MNAQPEEPEAAAVNVRGMTSGEWRMEAGTASACLFATGHTLFAYLAGALCFTNAVTMSFCADSTALFAVAR
jgi:hypothetical protein